MGSQRVRHYWVTNTFTFFHTSQPSLYIWGFISHSGWVWNVILLYFCLSFWKIYLCMYVWLCWVFIAVWRLFSSYGERGLLWVVVRGLLIAVASLVVAHGLRSCGIWPYLPCGMWHLPRAGTEPMSPALAGGFFTIGPPGQPSSVFLLASFLPIWLFLFPRLEPRVSSKDKRVTSGYWSCVALVLFLSALPLNLTGQLNKKNHPFKADVNPSCRMQLSHAEKTQVEPAQPLFTHVIPMDCGLWWNQSVCACSVSHSGLTLHDPMDCSLPGSSVLGILQARILEWVAISFSRGSSWPKD